jgi:hypothetical protein
MLKELRSAIACILAVSLVGDPVCARGLSAARAVHPMTSATLFTEQAILARLSNFHNDFTRIQALREGVVLATLLLAVGIPLFSQRAANAHKNNKPAVPSVERIEQWTSLEQYDAAVAETKAEIVHLDDADPAVRKSARAKLIEFSNRYDHAALKKNGVVVDPVIVELEYVFRDSRKAHVSSGVIKMMTEIFSDRAATMANEMFGPNDERVNIFDAAIRYWRTLLLTKADPKSDPDHKLKRSENYWSKLELWADRYLPPSGGKSEEGPGSDQELGDAPVVKKDFLLTMRYLAMFVQAQRENPMSSLDRARIVRQILSDAEYGVSPRFDLYLHAPAKAGHDRRFAPLLRAA